MNCRLTSLGLGIVCGFAAALTAFPPTYAYAPPKFPASPHIPIGSRDRNRPSPAWDGLAPHTMSGF